MSRQPWTTESWLPTVEVLDWPFYDWCRRQHASALGAVEGARDHLAAVERGFETEDREARAEVDRIVRERREAMASALRAGTEPPAEEAPPEPSPRTGPLRRELELKAAREQVAEAEQEVHRTAAAIVNTLSEFLYELDEAAERAEQIVRREFEQAKACEVKARKRFHKDTADEIPDAARCPHCALSPIETNTAWGVTPNARSLDFDVKRLREWLLGPLITEQVGGWDPTGDPAEHDPDLPRPEYGKTTRPRKETRYERPYPYERTSVAIRLDTGQGVDVPPEPVMERPSDAPLFDEVAALEGLDRQDVFRERVGWPVGAVVEEMRAAA